MIDYHVHTSLCNHAEGVMEAYIQKAVDIGLKEICFLDHLIISEPANRLSMTPDEVPFYFQAIQFFNIFDYAKKTFSYPLTLLKSYLINRQNKVA